MTKQPRSGRPLFKAVIFHRRGFSLIEITLALLITVFLIGGVVLTGRGAIEDARQEEIWRTLFALREISVQYKAEKGMFPVSIEEMKAFDVRVPVINPWGNAYAVSPGASLWCVETRVPLGREDIHQSGVFASVLSREDGEFLRVCRPVQATS